MFTGTISNLLRKGDMMHVGREIPLGLFASRKFYAFQVKSKQLLLQVGYPPFWCDNYSHLLKNIEEGSYCMPKRYWISVSSEAQELVKEMVS